MLIRLEFEIRRIQFKIKKIGEFYRMYKKWAKFFDKRTNEKYKEKY